MPIGQDSGRLCFGLLGLVEMDFPVTSMCEVGEYVAIHDGVGAGLVRCAKLTGNDVECGRRGTKNRRAHAADYSSAAASHASSRDSLRASSSLQFGIELAEPDMVGRRLRHRLVQRGDLVVELGQLALRCGPSPCRSVAPAPTPTPAALRLRPGRRTGFSRGPVGEILLDAAGQQVAAPAAGERIGDVGDPFEEVPVVGDDDQRARPAVQVVLDHGQRVDVEVVGRLVEQQHVRLVEQQPQELQPAPLAAGQVGHPRGQLVAGEAEVLQQGVGADLPAARQFGDAAAVLDGVEHPVGARRVRPAPGSGSRSAAWCRA